MKLRALGNLSGKGLTVEQGAEFDVPDDEGQALIDRKIAEPVEVKPAPKRKPAEGE